jgi:hypothetical protein
VIIAPRNRILAGARVDSPDAPIPANIVLQA